MSVVVVYPIWDVQVPVLGDYLNHLARMHILGTIDSSAELRRLYEIEWRPIPYLSMDAAFVVLNRVTSIYDAGRLFVGLCVLLPAASVVMLHYAVHRKVSLVPVAAFLFCYNYVLKWGFLPFLPALCLAVMAFAGWVATSGWSRWPRAALFSGLALVVYLGHLVAFGAYGLMLGSFELTRAWRAGFRPWRSTLADWSAFTLQAVPALIVLIAMLSVHVDRPFVGPVGTEYGPLIRKLFPITSPVLFLADKVEVLFALVLFLVLLVGLLTKCIRLAPAIWPVALAVGIAAVGMPHILLGTAEMDIRLPLLVAMLLTSAVSATDRLSWPARTFVLVVFVGAASFHALRITPTLRVLDGQISELRELVSALPKGQRLLVVEPPLRTGDLHVGYTSQTWHMPFVATIDRDAFLPYLFTGLGIVHPVPSMLPSSTPNGLPISPKYLADGLMRNDDPSGDQADGGGGRIYWLGWPHKFDYVLVLHFGNPSVEFPPILQCVKTSSIADLYRIIPPR